MKTLKDFKIKYYNSRCGYMRWNQIPTDIVDINESAETGGYWKLNSENIKELNIDIIIRFLIKNPRLTPKIVPFLSKNQAEELLDRLFRKDTLRLFLKVKKIAKREFDNLNIFREILQRRKNGRALKKQEEETLKKNLKEFPPIFRKQMIEEAILTLKELGLTFEENDFRELEVIKLGYSCILEKYPNEKNASQILARLIFGRDADYEKNPNGNAKFYRANAVERIQNNPLRFIALKNGQQSIEDEYGEMLSKKKNEVSAMAGLVHDKIFNIIDRATLEDDEVSIEKVKNVILENKGLIYISNYHQSDCFSVPLKDQHRVIAFGDARASTYVDKFALGIFKKALGRVAGQNTKLSYLKY